MHVASLELCKELYELSGWEPWLERIDCGWYSESGDWRRTASSVYWIPAYDLGYLLRKLPDSIPNMQYEFVWRLSLKKLDKIGFTATYENYSWATSHKSAFSRRGFDSDSVAALATFYGNTPEDAACKLAIELFKQGILTK